MGCSSSTQQVQNVEEWDPRVPFTPCQVMEIKTFWNLVKRRCEEIARENLMTFFHLHPDLRELFPELRDLGDEDLRYNPVFEAQAMVIFSLYDDVIIHMDKDVDYIIDKLQEVGRFHAKIPDFQADFFQYFEEPLIEVLKDKMCEHFTDNEEALMRQLFLWIEQTMAEEVALMGGF